MPEYLAPGVYVEETSFRAKSIEGVSTSTAGFVGPTRFGPIRGEPELVTSFAAFSRIYGGLDQLEYAGNKVHNYLAQGVRAFFEEGGSRLYVTRAFKAMDASDGVATTKLAAAAQNVTISARYPGSAGNMRVSCTLRFGLDILGKEPVDPAQPDGDSYTVLRGISNYDLVWVGTKEAAGGADAAAAKSPAAAAAVAAGAAKRASDAAAAAQAAADATAAKSKADADANPTDTTKAAAAKVAADAAAAAKTAADTAKTAADTAKTAADAATKAATDATAAAKTDADNAAITAKSAAVAAGAAKRVSDAAAAAQAVADATAAKSKAAAEANATDTTKTAAAKADADAATAAKTAAETAKTAADTAATAATAAKTAADAAALTAAAVGNFYWVERFFNGQRQTYRLRQDATDGDSTSAILIDTLAAGTEVHVVTLSMVASFMGANGKPTSEQGWQDISFHPAHPKSLTAAFDAAPASRATVLYVPVVVQGLTTASGKVLMDIMLAQTGQMKKPLSDVFMAKGLTASEADLTFRVMLSGGNDGVRPPAGAYEGDEGTDALGADQGKKSGLKTFEDIDDISIVAAPGSTFDYESDYKKDADQIQRLLIGHCERMRYRIAVLDSADNHLVSQVRNYRAQLDSSWAALYYPWIRTLDPFTEQPINLPPSGFVAGIYARNDVEQGAHKAPANEVVRLALGFSVMLNKAQQDVLNPEGINCFRFFEGAGYRLWGARTISSDPEWKYVNLRRYFAYLEHSIEKSTGWAVFMNNAEPLWAKVRQTIEDFLFSEWKSSHLMGVKPDQAYFVKCDRSTMTQNDIDNGRMICQIGVSPLRPAEFVIFQIGQWTANS